jgi:hypothetical protein
MTLKNRKGYSEREILEESPKATQPKIKWQVAREATAKHYELLVTIFAICALTWWRYGTTIDE